MNSLCSIQLLESALAGSLSSDEESALHEHLETCESCGVAMEQLAGGPGWCQQAAALLGEGEYDHGLPGRDDWSMIDFTVEHLEPADEPNLLGRLGGYDVLEIIGRGGMGVVLKGFDRELKRCVAIKVLAPHLAHSPLARKRFAREAQAAAAVVHPHVLAIHQVQPGGRLPFLVMPLVAGESLAQRLAARGTLELKEILRIGMQAAAGLAAAHEQGLVHRDVKPANILLEKGVERAVLTDFGLARAADDVAMTRWGIIAGTPQYMSPEQAQGQALDGRSDLFSLGCVLYEMATGSSPFRADSTIATMRRLVDDQPASMSTLNSELPQWFVNIVDRLLEKSPAQRFDSAAEVSDLLERCLAHVQQPATVSVPKEICTAPRQTDNSQAPRLMRLKRPSGKLLGLMFSVLLVAGSIWGLSAMWGHAIAAQHHASETNLQRLTAALMAYEEEHGHYPAAAIYGKDGKGGPPHSWRVEILPYLGQKALYEQYHFDEFWDSEHNRTLFAKIPAVLRSPSDTPDSVNTSYFGVVLDDPKIVFAAPVPGPAGSSSGPPAAPGATSGPASSGGTATPAEGGGGSAGPSSTAMTGMASGGVGFNPVDDFVSRRLYAAELGGLLKVDKREWLRRVTLDLTGVPPTEEEYKVLLAKDDAALADQTVERLLKESKQFTIGSTSNGIFVPNRSTFFSTPQGARNLEITDGTSNTIAIVEAKRSIPWSKPEDLSYNSTLAASPFGGWYAQGWYAGFVDGRVKFLSHDNPPKLLRALLVKDDGEPTKPILAVPSDTKSALNAPASQTSAEIDDLKGTITSISESDGTCIINIGVHDGVKPQDDFVVLREIVAGDRSHSNTSASDQMQVIGRIRVAKVNRSDSLAHVLVVM